MDIMVKYDNDWDSMGNNNYDALDDLRNDFTQFL